MATTLIKTTFTIAGWAISTLLTARKDKELQISVEHTDNTPVTELGEDISTYNTLGYSFSSEGIDAKSKDSNSDSSTSESPIAKASITVDDWSIEVVVESDGKLNLYATSLEGNDAEHDSLTNGTSHSKSCDIEIYQG
jgi:hypothetical protein